MDVAAHAQYLTFTLDQELFAVEIRKVREVLELTAMTKVPRVPAFMRGVINLRGNVVPVLDMRLKLGLGMTPRTRDTCVVIAELRVDGEPTVLGVLVDSVEEVIDLDPSLIAPPPQLGSRIETAVISGVGKRDDHFVLLLDVDRLFTTDELQASKMPQAADAEAGTAQPLAL